MKNHGAAHTADKQRFPFDKLYITHLRARICPGFPENMLADYLKTN
jgi:hypothetical protein